MMPPEERDELDYVLPDRYTEKELEPLRILVFRMKWVRDLIVQIRAGEKVLSRYELQSKISAMKALREIIQSEVEGMADAYRQLPEFQDDCDRRCAAAPKNTTAQTLAVLQAVDYFGNKNNLFRTVSQAEQDQIEALWQRVLQDLSERHVHSGG